MICEIDLLHGSFISAVKNIMLINYRTTYSSVALFLFPNVEHCVSIMRLYFLGIEIAVRRLEKSLLMLEIAQTNFAKVQPRLGSILQSKEIRTNGSDFKYGDSNNYKIRCLRQSVVVTDQF